MPSPVADLRHASRLVVRELGFLNDRCGPAPATHAQAHALIELGRQGPLPVTGLASILGLDKSTASRTVAGLARRRWVRLVTSRQDRRTKHVTLTAAGRTVLAGIHRAANTQVDRALARLAPEARDTVVRGMGLYADALRRSRLAQGIVLRRIRPADDPAVAGIIRRVMTEYGAVGAGYSIHDAEVDHISAAYRGPRAGYWVVEQRGRVVGGGGFGPLAGADPSVCELRKMYFEPEVRGLGLGRKLVETILAGARRAGYRTCYLETLERMHEARRLYERLGFVRTSGPLGATGHSACEAWYQRPLRPEA